MIYITGDTHGDRNRFSETFLKDEKNWTEKDYLLVCGDFGFVFADDEREKKFLDLLEEKPYTICFCDGNHENFAALENYPKKLWNGGYAHIIRKNVIHLMRGNAFNIDGKKIFAMGGAYSLDRYTRIKNLSYWEEELPNDRDYRDAQQTLMENNFEFDIIVSHTAPREIIRRLGKYPDVHDMELTGFLEWIMYEAKYTQWYFGHFHTDKKVTDKFTAVHFELHQIK